MSAAFELNDVGRVLGSPVATTVLSGISFRVERGEFVALTGTSGSGKSTLLYLLGALDVPTSGTVRILGHDTGALPERDRTRLRGESIGFVFQFHFLISELSAEENIALPMLRAGVRRAEALRRARDTLAWLDVGELAGRRPSTMSGGQQQRVAIARAIAHQPAILLADEPTGSLDSANSERVIQLLERLNRDRGVTIVMVTHDEDLATRCQRRIHLHDGSVLRDMRNGDDGSSG